MQLTVLLWKNEEQTHPYEDKDKNRDEVIRSRNRVLIGQTKEVHDGGAHAQYTLDFVSWCLVRIDGPDLRLSRGPGGLLQVNLQPEELKTNNDEHCLKLRVPTGLRDCMDAIPLGLEELYDWPSQLLRAAGCVRGKAWARQNSSVRQRDTFCPIQLRSCWWHINPNIHMKSSSSLLFQWLIKWLQFFLKFKENTKIELPGLK